MVARKFGLKPANISTQVLSRDRHAEFFLALALIASSCEKVAIEIRHLQRTEVGEVEEPFGAGQKGSSAMPHKKNPVLSENITGLARLVRSYAIAALEDVSLWHERDISHSSVERVIAPDATILMDFMLDRLCFILSGLRVYPEKMLQNLDKTHGAIFSGDILLLLVSKGMTREEAYKLVQRLAMSAMRKGVHIREEILRDEKLCKLIKRDELEEIFDLSRHTRYMDYIFGKVFGRRPR
jgi:adenylosuccinate lyase